LRHALAQAARRSPWFRVVHYSVQVDHLHLIVEASDKRALSSGMRGLVVRIARQVNRLLMRKGPLGADRWHARALTLTRQVRNALVYVFGNFRKHERRAPQAEVDPFSSAPYFDGWSGPAPPMSPSDSDESGVVAARTWLMRTGWRRR